MEHVVYRLTNINFNELICDFQNKFRPIFKKTNYQSSTTILILEQYYFRIESNLTITIIFDRINENLLEVDIVPSGGGHGLFQFSYGAEKSALKKIIKFFDSYNALIQ